MWRIRIWEHQDGNDLLAAYEKDFSTKDSAVEHVTKVLGLSLQGVENPTPGSKWAEVVQVITPDEKIERS